MSTTTTKRPKASEPAEPATFAEIAARKMSETITAYRRFVTRAASNERLTGDDLEKVLEALAYMRLPEYAWERDVQAMRDHAAATAAIAEMAGKAEADAERLAVVVERIKAVEAELKALKGEHYTLTQVNTMQRVGQMQRVNELAMNHPHVFMDVADAARLRQEAKDKAAGVRPQPAGDEPMTTWRIGG